MVDWDCREVRPQEVSLAIDSRGRFPRRVLPKGDSRPRVWEKVSTPSSTFSRIVIVFRLFVGCFQILSPTLPANLEPLQILWTKSAKNWWPLQIPWPNPRGNCPPLQILLLIVFRYFRWLFSDTLLIVFRYFCRLFSDTFVDCFQIVLLIVFR